MPLTKKEFRDNLISLLIENNINISSEDKFIIKPIKEKNVSYNSFDDYVRIWFLQEKNINRYFYFQEAIDFLSFSNDNKTPKRFVFISSFEKRTNVIPYFSIASCR